MSERVTLCEPTDAFNFQPGMRIGGPSQPSWRIGAIVEAVDYKAGAVTFRDATRWERLWHALSFPYRWLRWRLLRCR